MDASHRNGSDRRLRRRALAIGAALVLGSLPLRWWEDRHWSPAHHWLLTQFHGNDWELALRVITALGNGAMLGFVLACLVAILPWREAPWRAAVAAIMVGAINGLLKYSVGRTRPQADQGDDAWPSGHTAATVAVTVALWSVNRRAGLFALPVVLMVAMSRVLLVRHYPADVMAGVGMGLIIGTVATAFSRSPRVLMGVEIRWVVLAGALLLWSMREMLPPNVRVALGTIGSPLLMLALWHVVASGDDVEATR